MTRRFENFTQQVHDWFRQQQERHGDIWIDREVAILELKDQIPPGEAVRESEKMNPQHHARLDQTQRVSRGRRNKLITVMSSLQRGGHLYMQIEGNKTLYRFRDKEKEGAAESAPVQRRRAPTTTTVVTEAIPIQTVPTTTVQFHEISKSDVAHQFEITDVLVNGQPRIRVKFENLTFEFSASAADAFCDRISAQLTYARGTAMALQQVDIQNS